VLLRVHHSLGRDVEKGGLYRGVGIGELPDLDPHRDAALLGQMPQRVTEPPSAERGGWHTYHESLDVVGRDTDLVDGDQKRRPGLLVLDAL
jgi:hypothetical protein